jgi:hypothetical protein
VQQHLDLVHQRVHLINILIPEDDQLLDHPLVLLDEQRQGFKGRLGVQVIVEEGGPRAHLLLVLCLAQDEGETLQDGQGRVGG